MIRQTILALLLASALSAQTTGEAILKRVDANLTADNKIITSKMIIHGRRSTRTMEARSYINGTTKSFTEYLAPARDAGTKMLKLDDQLWTYSPQSDRIIKISGHMLRQSVMGSDLSYEDMMEDPRLAPIYSAEILGEEEYDGRLCWVLKLVADKAETAYPQRKVWVDKERFIFLKEERLAKSGKMLKTTIVSDVKQIDGRWTATHARFKDELQTGDGTEFIIEAIQFNARIPEHYFTKAALRK